ncbi:MAG: thioesterase family protein [Thermoanaerobaculia bacterium]|nr:thioesterase family protein [Thermoanaerobaculia bacterium]
MGDLTKQTRPDRVEEGVYEVELSPDWDVWGPNGGYVSAAVLRAVGRETDRRRPISYLGQYLGQAAFRKAKIRVECIKPGRRVSAYTAGLEQDGELLVRALVWTGEPGEGPEHQLTGPPGFFVPLEEAGDRPPVGPMPCWDNLEIREVKSSGGHYSHWYRFVPPPDIDDPFADAARSLVLIDMMQWPARYYMTEDRPEYVAPSLDLAVRFHRVGDTSEWLFSDARSPLAREGLVAGEATVWDAEGHCLASGGSQSLLLPAEAPY